MPRYLRPKLHPLFLNSSLNDDWEVVVVNIYQSCLFVAMKLHVSVKELERSKTAIFANSKLLVVIIELSRFLDRKVIKRTSHALICATSISRILLLRAFHRILSLRPYRYREILPTLLKLVHSGALDEMFGGSLMARLEAVEVEMLNRILF